MFASEMSDEERDMASQFFTDVQSSLTALIIIARPRSEDGSADALHWAVQTERLVGMRRGVEMGEEAFFVDLTLSLEPPSQIRIDDTNRLMEQVGQKIASAKKAQAIVALIDDLAGLTRRLRQA